MTDDTRNDGQEDRWSAYSDDALLNTVQSLTALMREHQALLSELGKRRRVVIRALRERKVPYRLIASVGGISEQAIYADLRKHPLVEGQGQSDE